MTVKVNADGTIMLDGRDTGLKVSQTPRGTVVFTPEQVFKGKQYREHKMPHSRYSTSHPEPGAGLAGLNDFERDIRALLAQVK